MLAMIVSGWPQWLSATGSRGCAQHPRDPGLVVPLREQCWGSPRQGHVSHHPLSAAHQCLERLGPPSQGILRKCARFLCVESQFSPKSFFYSQPYPYRFPGSNGKQGSCRSPTCMDAVHPPAPSSWIVGAAQRHPPWAGLAPSSTAGIFPGP